MLLLSSWSCFGFDVPLLAGEGELVREFKLAAAALVEALKIFCFDLFGEDTGDKRRGELLRELRPSPNVSPALLGELPRAFPGPGPKGSKLPFFKGGNDFLPMGASFPPPSGGSGP